MYRSTVVVHKYSDQEITAFLERYDFSLDLQVGKTLALSLMTMLDKFRDSGSDPTSTEEMISRMAANIRMRQTRRYSESPTTSLKRIKSSRELEKFEGLSFASPEELMTFMRAQIKQVD